MGTFSSVRIEANSDLLETGLSGADDRHSLKRVLTYGTFDLLHYGHIRLLQQASKLGDYLIVGLSTDEFNALKGKRVSIPMMCDVRCLKRCVMLTW